MSITLSSAAPSFAKTMVRPMVRPLRNWPFLSSASFNAAFPSAASTQGIHLANKLTAPPPELESETEEGLALPVEPDEGTVLIPDDERVVNVPS